MKIIIASPNTWFSSAQSLSCVWLFGTPWTAVRQASLSITNSRRLLKHMSIESVMPSNHLILCHPLLLLSDNFQVQIKRRRQWHPTPVLLPGKFHGRRSLVGCSSWGRKELDTTERFHFHVSFSCIGKGNGNGLQCSCLENPRDGEPGGLLSMGSHRVGHNWSDLAAAAQIKRI